MSNYTKTTNFATKDSLPSGDPNKIVKGAEINTEFDNIATAVSTKSNSESPTFTGTVTIPTADINGGAIDGTTIGGTTAASITGTTLTANTSLNIAGDGATVTGIKDEDDMASNSATKLATQQSIKAYVDSQVTAQDLDVTTDSGTISIDLDSETLTVAGGTGLDSSATGNTVTLGIDSTVATLTGTQTLTNKTLTSPDVNTPDIDGGTIDGTVIGGTTPAAVSATTVSATGNITVGGTVDGRDVAADGAKLDNIEANADVTDTANVTAAGALMDSEVINLAQVKAFDSADYATAAQGTTADSALQNVVEDTTPQLGGDLGTNGNDILFADNDKAIFGAGSDLQIYHDGNNSRVEDTGTGGLRLIGSNFVSLQSSSGENKIVGNSNGSVQLFYDNAEKLATTSTGINVTGKVSSDGLEVDLSSSGNVELTGAANSNAGLVVRDPTATSYGAHFSYDDANTRVSIGGQTNGTKNTAISIGRDSNDISFYEDTGTTPKLFWDASAERLGIGTTSPDQALTVSGNIQIQDNDGYLQFKDTNGGTNNKFRRIYNSAQTLYISRRNDDESLQANDVTIDSSGQVGIGTSSPQYVLDVSGKAALQDALLFTLNTTQTPSAGGFIYRPASNTLAFGTTSLERLRIDSSGNVGIGTSSPSFKLDVAGNARASYFALRSNESAPSESSFIYRPATGVLGFGTGTAERMRIDSSGNLLVGKTSASSATVGFQAGQDGFIAATRASAQPLVLNRTTNDGIIADFRKDGSTVGSIGTASSGDLYIADGRNAGIKLDGGNNQVLPVTSTGSPLDATLDLGVSGARFKDLYLSGGVYLGGTSNVNKLDDYEEGTWTPAFGGTTTNPSVTYTVAAGNYTKVGRLVTVSWRLQVSAISGGSGLAQITGLPFSQATASGNAHVQICALSSMAGPATKNGGFVEPNTAFIYLCNDNGITFSPSTLGTGIFFATASYFTT